MHYYIFTGVLFGLYCLMLEIGNVERKLSALLPALILMALFIGLRAFHIGTDTATYVEIYHYVPSIEQYLSTFKAGYHGDRMEIGFFLLLSTLKGLSVAPSLVLIIISLLTLVILAVAYKRLCPNYFIGFFVLSVTILFFSQEYNIIRQGLASAFVLLALSYLSERKRLSYLILTIIAASFHIIALLSLCLYPLRKMKWRPKYLIFLLSIFICLSFINVLEGIVFQLKTISIIFWRVFLYFQAENTELKILSWMFLSTILLISFTIFYVDEIREKYQHIDLIITFVTIGMLGVLFTHELSMLSVRLGFLFFIAEPILIMALLTLIKDEFPKFLLVFTCSVLILVKNIFITAQFLSPYSY